MIHHTQYRHHFGEMPLWFSVFYELMHLPNGTPVTLPVWYRLEHSPEGGPATIDEDAFWCSRLVEVLGRCPVSRAKLMDRINRHVEALRRCPPK